MFAYKLILFCYFVRGSVRCSSLQHCIICNSNKLYGISECTWDKSYVSAAIPLWPNKCDRINIDLSGWNEKTFIAYMWFAENWKFIGHYKYVHTNCIIIFVVKLIINSTRSDIWTRHFWRKKNPFLCSQSIFSAARLLRLELRITDMVLYSTMAFRSCSNSEYSLTSRTRQKRYENLHFLYTDHAWKCTRYLIARRPIVCHNNSDTTCFSIFYFIFFFVRFFRL